MRVWVTQSDSLMTSVADHETAAGAHHPSPSDSKPFEDAIAENLELRDLQPVAVLGEGAFGMVQLVTHKVRLSRWSGTFGEIVL